MFFRPVLSCLLLIGFLVSIIWACQQNPKEPEKTKTVVKNEGFSDPKSCEPCHKKEVESFLQTGKGRSFFPASSSKSFENWNASPVYDSKSDFYYLPFQRKDSFFVKEFRLENGDTIHSRTEKIDFFIGSGNQTRSYLFQRMGYLYEIPITWYSRKKIWDLSPGYENGANHRFEREVGEECLFCHNSGFEAVPNAVNRYTNFGKAIACESCHGSVKNHLGAKQKGSSKTSENQAISLGKLPLQAQLDVCRQCHLEGVKVRKEKAKSGDYSPGKLLADYYEIFVPVTGENDFGFASHAERLQLSQCFISSAGKMNCNSCHDPHSSIPAAGKIEFFTQKCLNCHSGDAHQKSCSDLKRRKSDPMKANCVSCHLQTAGTNDIPHVNSTDHWIRREINPKKQENGKKLRFKNFAGNKFSNTDKTLALLQFAETRGDSQNLKEVGEYLKLLSSENKLKYFYLSGLDWKNSLDTNGFSGSENPWTWFYWSQLKKKSGLPFYSDLATACQLAPDMIEFQYRLALVNSESGNQAAYNTILKLNPLHVKSLSNLGFYALQTGDKLKAEELLKKAISQDPDNVLANENLARCFMEQGKFANCKAIVNRLIKKFPEELRYRQVLASIP